MLPTTIGFQMSLRETGNWFSSDTVEVCYIVDGGTPVCPYSTSNDFGSADVFQDGLTASSTLQVTVHPYVQSTGDVFFMDDFLVFGTTRAEAVAAGGGQTTVAYEEDFTGQSGKGRTDTSGVDWTVTSCTSDTFQGACRRRRRRRRCALTLVLRPCSHDWHV